MIPPALERTYARLWWLAWMDVWRAIGMHIWHNTTDWDLWCWLWFRVGWRAARDAERLVARGQDVP